MAEDSEFLSYGRLANILLGVLGVIIITAVGWLKAGIDANSAKVEALEIQRVQLSTLQERMKTEELAQMAASISQTAENTAMMKVYKEEIDNLYKVNALREVRRGR